MFQAISKKSVSDVVFEQLRSRILNAELRPGEELPAERLLCELLQVSRNAVREAIKRLQEAGLVEVRHGGATTVLDYREKAGPELLPILLLDAEGHLRLDVARSIVRMRQVLSPAIAADAARAANAEYAEKLQSICEQMAATKSTPQRQSLALGFWAVLVTASGNIAYQLAFNSLNKTYQPIFSLLTNMLSKEFHDLDNFSNIADAVRNADAPAAEAAARRTIDASTTAILKFLDAYEANAAGASLTGQTT